MPHERPARAAATSCGSTAANSSPAVVAGQAGNTLAPAVNHCTQHQTLTTEFIPVGLSMMCCSSASHLSSPPSVQQVLPSRKPHLLHQHGQSACRAGCTMHALQAQPSRAMQTSDSSMHAHTPGGVPPPCSRSGQVEACACRWHQGRPANNGTQKPQVLNIGSVLVSVLVTPVQMGGGNTGR